MVCVISYNAVEVKYNRYSTLDKQRALRFPKWAKIPTLYRDKLRSLKQEKGLLFELHRREGGGG